MILMQELEQETYEITNIESLLIWYYRFEQIHPFQDGNGRVGGIVVAAISQALNRNMLKNNQSEHYINMLAPVDPPTQRS